MQAVFAKQSLVSVVFHITTEAKPCRSVPLIGWQWTPMALLHYDVNRTTPGKRLFLGKMLSIQFFNSRPRNPLLTSRFVVMSFFTEDSAIRFLSCPFTLELYYSLHSFCIFWSVFFFFVCTFTHCLSLFFFFIMFYALLEKTNKQKLPEKQFYSMNIKPRLEDPINLFHYLQHLSVFFMITASGPACVFACVSFYYRPPIRKCASWYC